MGPSFAGIRYFSSALNAADIRTAGKSTASMIIASFSRRGIVNVSDIFRVSS